MSDTTDDALDAQWRGEAKRGYRSLVDTSPEAIARNNRPLPPLTEREKAQAAWADERRNQERLRTALGLIEYELKSNPDAIPAARELLRTIELGDSEKGLQFRRLPDPFTIPPLSWHAKGLLVRDTYGEIAGPNKSLKTYFGLALDVGLMAGKAIMGRWENNQQQRVLLLMGEGGENTLLRRLERMAKAYRVSINDIRPWLSYSVVPMRMSSPDFAASIDSELQRFQPDVVHLDPWYGYAPRGVETRNLIDVGAGLDELRSIVGNTTLVINNHMNQTGQGFNLTRITGAGHSEWSDSWWLLDHRNPGDVARGEFQMRLAIGSRQWGGGEHNVDLSIGAFDEALNEHRGNISWRVAPATETSSEEREQIDQTGAMLAIIRAWNQRRGPTKEEPMLRADWLERVRGQAQLKRAAFAVMVEDGRILRHDRDVIDSLGRHSKKDSYTLAKSLWNLL